MKLNQDCVRLCLIFIENYQDDLNKGITFEEISLSTQLNKFASKEILYTLIQLKDGGLIDGVIQYKNGRITSFHIYRMKWKGHQFIDTVRDPRVWKETKKITSKLSTVSLSIVESVAAGLIAKFLGV